MAASGWADSSRFGLTAHSFYIPGYSIRSYQPDENIPLLVNKVFSDDTELQYPYFDLPFVCPPSGLKHDGSHLASGASVALNLGEVLRGDRIRNSDMEVNMLQDVECRYLCDRVIGRREVQWAQELIEQGYVAEWILDDLPGATSFVTVDRQHKYYSTGFKLGSKEFDPRTGRPQYTLNNHFSIVVRWRDAPEPTGPDARKIVVAFEIYPKSIDMGQRNGTGCPLDLAGDHPPLVLDIPANATDLSAQYPDSSYVPQQEADMDDGATMVVPTTYSVYFRQTDEIEWEHRWDLYFSDQAETSFTHWLAIVNSLIISAILGAICIVIWTRTMQGDVKGKGDGKLAEVGADDSGSSEDEMVEDVSGWKLLHGDVFRPPAYGRLLAPLVGSGMQLVFMVAGLLLLSCFGVLNPSWRGGFISVGVGLFVFAGACSGYFSGRVYKTFGGQNARKNTLLASSTALPFFTLILLVGLWLLIQLPLVHLGASYGFKLAAWEHPTRTNSIARPVPPQAWYTRNQVPLALAAGLAPFAVLFIELLFVFKSLYLDKSSYYYVFGFLSIISALLTITIAETVMITTYIQLCAENYNWWWQSFAVGGSSGVWIFVYSTWYYATRLHVDGFVSTLLFFSYSALACMLYSLATGTIGFLSAYAFVRRIYGGVKVD
ncbi:hypothetical protein DV737_g4856, partial [Chaetothyriales sp. CBS 132003]